MYRTQEPPNAVQVELTEGCNLRCPFCGLNGIRSKKRDFKFLTPEVAQQIALLISNEDWNPRVEFAMHGEPTMHPDAAGMVRIFREYLPSASLMMTSNGGGLLRDPGPVLQIERLMQAGLNVLALDDYEHANIIPKVRAEWLGA